MSAYKVIKQAEKTVVLEDNLLLPLEKIKTPSYVLDEAKLNDNASVCKRIIKSSGCSILLALKAFSTLKGLAVFKDVLNGVTCSSLNEVKLANDYFNGEIHVYSPAFSMVEFQGVSKYAKHIVFNSLTQMRQFESDILDQISSISYGLRINPECSVVEAAIYNPSRSDSRFGVKWKDLEGIKLPNYIKGLHFHNLCTQHFSALEKTVLEVESKFGYLFERLDWINFGGGHMFTDPKYDVEALIDLIKYFSKKYNLKVYLEPGEAIVANAGYLVASVLDIVYNKQPIAILDTSASAHMPDVMEMPYRPNVYQARLSGELPFNYQLAGITCLSGDIIGDYSFAKPLTIGQKIIFLDMAQYTMVKNTMFNGVNLPSISWLSGSGSYEILREFDYSDFLSRLN